MEWHVATSGVIVPCNWSAAWQIPYGYLVADAQNVIAYSAITNHCDWVLFIEDDVLIPADFLLKLEGWIRKGDIPIISGLYHLKNSSKEPVLYRGRGNGAFHDFKYGDPVWVDGVPTGCLLVHISILREMAKIVDMYEVKNLTGSTMVWRIFESPRKWFADPEQGGFQKLLGTSDLYFCDQVMEKGILKKAGWDKVAKKTFPFLCDTSMLCEHIDRADGRRY